MASLQPGASWHGLSHLGAIAPGYQADLLVLPDLERFEPELVLKRGRPVGEIERPDGARVGAAHGARRAALARATSRCARRAAGCA